MRQADTPTAKERSQVLYWLKQANAPNISVIAKAVGKHRNTVQSWLPSVLCNPDIIWTELNASQV
ncbi:MAG: hypothetical protein LH647_18580 [Leptolyngbyaceae cyanobacterium CAN_BIN12]|nr:hypothetical protein [Leptolyngbyaceae cyanobacterium CAN_BIN12]